VKYGKEIKTCRSWAEQITGCKDVH